MSDWRSVWQDRTSEGWEVLFAVKLKSGDWLSVSRGPTNDVVTDYHREDGVGRYTRHNLAAASAAYDEAAKAVPPASWRRVAAKGGGA